MKKAIRIIDGIFALCLIIIYSFIVFGNIVLPDKIEAYSTKKIEYKSVYSVENNSLYRLITKITARFRLLKMILSFWVLSRLKQQALFNQSLKK